MKAFFALSFCIITIPLSAQKESSFDLSYSNKSNYNFISLLKDIAQEVKNNPRDIGGLEDIIHEEKKIFEQGLGCINFYNQKIITLYEDYLQRVDVSSEQLLIFQMIIRAHNILKTNSSTNYALYEYLRFLRKKYKLEILFPVCFQHYLYYGYYLNICLLVKHGLALLKDSSSDISYKNYAIIYKALVPSGNDEEIELDSQKDIVIQALEKNHVIMIMCIFILECDFSPDDDIDWNDFYNKASSFDMLYILKIFHLHSKWIKSMQSSTLSPI